MTYEDKPSSDRMDVLNRNCEDDPRSWREFNGLRQENCRSIGMNATTPTAQARKRARSIIELFCIGLSRERREKQSGG